MSRIYDLLRQAGIFYLATTDGKQAKVRPISDVLELDGKVLFCTGSHKEVYRQMVENPYVEIVAFSKGYWLRYTGKAVFETDTKYEEMALTASPHMRNEYNEETGKNIMVFHLEDAIALIMQETVEEDITE